MGTTKRERQKAARHEKLARQQQEAKRRQTLRRSVIIGIIAVLIVGTGAWIFSGNSSTTTTTVAAATTTTTAAATTTTAATSATTTTVAAATTTTAASTASAVNWPAVATPEAAGVWGTQPTVTVPTSAAPTSPERSVLIKGTGTAAANGDSLEVQYVLATYSSHKVVQSSWTSSPFTFTLGANSVITGWEQGLLGATQGSRVELVLPPTYGYGSSAPGNGIAANDTLIFVVDVLKVTK